MDEIIAVDELLSLAALKVEPLSDTFLTYKNFVLTLWARNCLNLSAELVPIPLKQFRRFFKDLWKGTQKPRKIKVSKKEVFLDWLAEKTGLKTYEIAQRFGHTLEKLFCEIESELGEVSEKDLDPRYIHLFLLGNPRKRANDR